MMIFRFFLIAVTGLLNFSHCHFDQLEMMFCRFGHVYHNLQNRLTKTLIHAFLDPAKSLTQHYGAVQGISALGPSAVEPNQCKLILCISHALADCICCLQIRLLILPNLVTYMQLLEPELQLEKQKNEMKRKEAWRVYGALLVSSELSFNSFYYILVEQLKAS